MPPPESVARRERRASPWHPATPSSTVTSLVLPTRCLRATPRATPPPFPPARRVPWRRTRNPRRRARPRERAHRERRAQTHETSTCLVDPRAWITCANRRAVASSISSSLPRARAPPAARTRAPRPGVARQVHRAELTDLRREDEDAVGVLGDDHLRVHAVDLERAVRAVDGHARRRRRGTGAVHAATLGRCAPNVPRPRLAVTSRGSRRGLILTSHAARGAGASARASLAQPRGGEFL